MKIIAPTLYKSMNFFIIYDRYGKPVNVAKSKFKMVCDATIFVKGGAFAKRCTAKEYNKAFSKLMT